MWVIPAPAPWASASTALGAAGDIQSPETLSAPGMGMVSGSASMPGRIAAAEAVCNDLSTATCEHRAVSRWSFIGIIAVLAAAAVVMVWRGAGVDAPPPPPKGVPVGEIAKGRPAPQIGLAGAFPAWAPLPDDGTAIGAETVPPQPPYGDAAVLMLKIDSDYPTFQAAYARRLAERGFTLNPVPIQPNLGVDRPAAQFEAPEKNGAHVIYVTYRGGASTRYVQLTYWTTPAPPLPIR